MDSRKKFAEMIGKTFMYKAVTHKILTVYENTNSISIATDKQLINIMRIDVSKELDQFLPVSDEPVTAVSVLGSGRNELKGLVDALKRNIELVNNDEKNIPKAKAINESIKGIIEVAKLEIEAIKLIRKTE